MSDDLPEGAPGPASRDPYGSPGPDPYAGPTPGPDAAPLPGPAPLVVLGVVPADPPYRVVEIRGEVVGTAHDLVDVVRIAHQAGLTHVDLDDPAVVRWVGGGKYHWVPRT
ncbi:hypothetical protein [Streptomyces sp. enrichment culture]|uniref:hypothetical protein n=1 Tax=Streptomyces sp. enrichment culture TaxID=1795815 RepID=UPI003F560FBD